MEPGKPRAKAAIVSKPQPIECYVGDTATLECQVRRIHFCLIYLTILLF